MENCRVICFYLGKECRYGEDAPPEEQMECSQCPVYIMWRELVLGDTRKVSQDPLIEPENGLDYDK